MQYTVVFQPSGCRGQVDRGTSLLAAARDLGVALEAPCGGAGSCGKCKVRIAESSLAAGGFVSLREHLSPLSEKEEKALSPAEMAAGCRLACCALVQGDVLVVVPEASRALKQVVLEEGIAREFCLRPAVRNYYVELNKPTLQDSRDDFSRLQDELQSRFIQLNKELRIDHAVLARLSAALRQGDWRVTATLWHDEEIIAVTPGRVERAYGVAMDIGTTTLAAYLCDLTSGRVVAQRSGMNSQVAYGDDVLARISYCAVEEDGLETLHRAIVGDMNGLLRDLAAEAGLEPAAVTEVVLVFNPVMHHLALRLDPEPIGRAPFVSAIRAALDLKGRELGLQIAPGGYVHCLPLEAGFVGADNVAVLLSERPYRQEKPGLVVDIGTNGEILCGDREGVFAASCATGPALEGAQIKFGMRAAPGAIEKVAIDPLSKEPALAVIGAAPGEAPAPRGICGSGIIDAVAELFKAGIIKRDGGFRKDLATPRVRRGGDGKYEYVLAWAAQTAIGQDLTITQPDVRAVQLAKAALYAGAKILMRKKGVAAVESIALAGAFGSYLNKENALVLGLVPDCPLEAVQAVGNAAGEGAKLALFDLDKRAEAQRRAREVCFVETAAEAEFQQEFMDAMFLPHAQDEFPHIRHILAAIPGG